MKAIVMAGGSGERLWPISRRNCPKQWVKLPLPTPNARTSTQESTPQTLIEQTFARLNRLIPRDHIFLSTQQAHFPLISQTLDNPPNDDHCILEPLGRDTATAILLATLVIARKNPDEDDVLFFTPADHYIAGLEQYTQTLQLAEKVAEMSQTLTVIGIPPTAPSIDYGYLETHTVSSSSLPSSSTQKLKNELNKLVALGFNPIPHPTHKPPPPNTPPQHHNNSDNHYHDNHPQNTHQEEQPPQKHQKSLKNQDNQNRIANQADNNPLSDANNEALPVRIVSRFHEKPSHVQATQYLEQGHFLWNAGMFFIKTSKLLEYFKQHTPDHVAKLEMYLDLIEQGDEKRALEIFEGLEKISFDYAIAEKVTDIRSVTGTFIWDDLGSLSALERIHHPELQAHHNTSLGSSEHTLAFSTQNTFVYHANRHPKQTLVLNHLNNLAIIVTDDVIYIADKEKALSPKELLKTLANSHSLLR